MLIELESHWRGWSLELLASLFKEDSEISEDIHSTIIVNRRLRKSSVDHKVVNKLASITAGLKNKRFIAIII